MRLSSSSDYAVALADLNRAASALSKWQAQVSSGRRLQLSSDDPTTAARDVADHAELGSLDQFVKTTDSAKARLTVVDSVLSDIVDRLTAAKASATAAQGSVATDVQREAIAKDLEGVADTILSDLNTSVGGTYVFSGSATLTAPYARQADGTVSAYQGNAAGVALDIGHARSVTVGLNGQALTQGSDAEDVFSSLSGLAAAIRNNDQAGIADGLAGLDRALGRVTAVQTGVGTDLASLDDQSSRLGTLRQASQSRISSAEDANLAEAATQMARADSAYQAALGAIGTRSRLTLMDYLK